MSINFDRLSVLAGLPAEKSNLTEGAHADHSDKKEEKEEKEETMSEMSDTDEAYHEGEEAEPVDEDDVMLEIDEVMLVQELRRAKRIMQENKRARSAKNRKQKIFESQLKRVIDEEVKNVFEELNLSGDWVYGKDKPRRSRPGYTHQGRYMPGIGFKK